METDLADSADQALEAGSCLIELPAGCGKTELLTAIAGRSAQRDERPLILTHTHAGVDALRHRLRRFGIPQSAVGLSTLASWTQRIVRHFPQLSGLGPTADIEALEWPETYEAAITALEHVHVAALISDTYSLVLVDEYQDCTVDQGTIVKHITGLVPTVVIGDRMQGIYGFRDNVLTDWDTLGLPFHEVDHSPWRWIGRNEDLGEWLLVQRQRLAAGEAIDLTDAPARWVADTPENRRTALHRLADGDGTAVVLDGFRNQRVTTAKSLGGRFGVMEELEGAAMLGFADQFDTGDGFQAGIAVIDFVKSCFTNVPSTYSGKAEALERRDIPTYREGACRVALDALTVLVDSPTAGNLVAALSAAEELPGTTLVCKEAWRDTLHAARWSEESEHTESATIRECIVKLRDRARLLGRRPERRTVSSTLLIKGLEYDRCVVLRAQDLDAENLYVAMTRARDKLVIMSDTPYLHPSTV
ncbi:MAG: UvrD-helicase domain-containing protein [Acidimicrobiales bacterium]